jgi:hypothetical protein
MNPCLGRGPLIATQETLSSTDTDMWDLFCVELDRYVHVESIAGTPYKYLSRIGSGITREILAVDKQIILGNAASSEQFRELFSQFFKYILLQKKLKFAFSGKAYMSAYSTTENTVKLSKEFLKFHCMLDVMHKTDVRLTDLIRTGLLIEARIHNGCLYYNYRDSSRAVSAASFQDRHVLYFKGNDIRSHVDDPVDTAGNAPYILHPTLVNAFLDQCLNYLNIYEHEKAKNIIKEDQDRDQQQEGEVSDRTCNRGKNTFKDYPLGEKRVNLSI